MTSAGLLTARRVGFDFYFRGDVPEFVKEYNLDRYRARWTAGPGLVGC